MANPYFEPGPQRAARVQALFDRVASRYDLLNDLQSFGLHRRWKRRLLCLARPQPGERALDVCCGTADLGLALAQQGLHVVGLDFSQEMLDVAAEKKKRVGNTSLQLVRGDAQQLPFEPGGFDIVTVGYGLRNLADWQMGLAEMVRVARPGGRVLVLDFGKPDNTLWRALYFGYLRLFVPLLGLVFCGSASAYSYILESLKHYPAQHGVAAKMRELGMKNVQLYNLLGGVMTINYSEKAQTRI
ncbi:MAG TPA: bifunctional demethylmenaquinone methyltransferase/2-methoxy-6-polyprenyl-1,4-benzoquinol methylase UbiE [Verrucomicrobiae bacterium]|nr:bifunctional demethylmenaquinone methyltransferase/2-methoxy-6-polyprenyl-1,4-benzoquinol methylase UbiE [Verrucomicrobiae bacterium]